MRFSIAAVLAFATATLAQIDGFHVITHPQKGEKLPVGSTYEIVWQPNADYPGEVTIGLLGGATPGTLSIVDTIAKHVDGADGTYSWKIPTSLGDQKTYGIMITLESDTTVFQYGFPFEIVSKGGDDDDEDDDDSSSTTTTTTGTATNTSSSSSSTKTKTSTVTSTTFSVSSSATITSSTVRGNLSTTAKTTITSVVTGGPSTTTSATSTIVTNGVASMAAGGFAMLGGVAMAVLAL